MENIADVTKAVASSVAARVKNPFIGSFLLSWLVFNWQAILYIFAITEPVSSRIQSIASIVSRAESSLFPLIFAVGYFIISPWLWFLLRMYSDIADDRAKLRQRRREIEDIQHQNKVVEVEAKLLQEQRQKLQLSKEIQKKKSELTTLFDQQLQELKDRFSSAADELNAVADLVESKRIPALVARIEEVSQRVEELQTSFKSSIGSFNVAANRMRSAVHQTAEAQKSSELDVIEKTFADLAPASSVAANLVEDLNGLRSFEAIQDNPTAEQLREAGLDEDEVPAYIRRSSK